MSGVYIKGMEMPKSCGNCFFDTHCDNWRLRNWGSPPPDDCPLAPVSPHGRLGDLDALKETIEALIEKHLHGYTKSTWDFVCELRSIIRNAPTIIEAEEGET